MARVAKPVCWDLILNSFFLLGPVNDRIICLPGLEVPGKVWALLLVQMKGWKGWVSDPAQLGSDVRSSATGLLLPPLLPRVRARVMWIVKYHARCS